jgi:hypothetical protein
MTARLAGRSTAGPADRSSSRCASRWSRISKRWNGGALVLLVYLLAALGTLTVASRHHLLPLFEGVGPPARYEWVNPPAEFAVGNEKPVASALDIPLTGPEEPSSATSPDGQFVVNLPENAFGSHGSDTRVHTVITPLDPGKLGRTPAGLVPDGNAYRIEFTFEPSGAPVTTLALPGNVIISSPHGAVAMLYSPTGASWKELQTQMVSAPTIVGGTISAPGVFLVGTTSGHLTPTITVSKNKGTAFIAGVVIVAAAILGLIAVLVVVRRRRE